MIETGEKPDGTRLSIEAVKKQSKKKPSKINGLINAAKKSRSVFKHRRGLEQKH
ncbi:hypothetical protein LL240_04880 [Oceanimonas baumannii]|uniref:hypothetical protein n=1 Tax=Oceanimonas baumannii TaxID=129578 RepID=UPI001D190B8C|nr:hypothetical protein [Oceanimonas baumannii]MCC4263789.1 hypothetical protein [Oceanimonas baumannii]